METSLKGIERFLQVVVKHTEFDKLIASIEHQQREDADTCLTASEIAAHLIVDLHSEQSSERANINRITTNLENVADELLTYSKIIKSLGSP
jgi:hypothetical protein